MGGIEMEGEKYWIKIGLSVLILAALGCGMLMPAGNLRAYVVDGCLVGILLFLHVFMPQIAGLAPGNPKIRTMRRYNFLMGVILAFFAAGHLLFPDVQMAEDGDGRALLIFSVILTLVMGNAAPRIPVNRVMGIRLPWTLKDPDTWRAAHRMMGYCAFPTAVFMLAGGLMVHPVIFSVGGLLMVAVIPSVYSYIYDRRKRRF